MADERILLQAHLGSQQRFDRGAHAIDDRMQIPGLVDGRPLQLVDRGQDGPALRMSEHDHEPRAVALRRKLDAADL